MGGVFGVSGYDSKISAALCFSKLRAPLSMDCVILSGEYTLNRLLNCLYCCNPYF